MRRFIKFIVAICFSGAGIAVIILDISALIAGNDQVSEIIFRTVLGLGLAVAGFYLLSTLKKT